MKGGSVESASMVVPVTNSYDKMVMTAASRWLYQPATMNGTPVKFRKRIQITVTPPAPWGGGGTRCPSTTNGPGTKHQAPERSFDTLPACDRIAFVVFAAVTCACCCRLGAAASEGRAVTRLPA